MDSAELETFFPIPKDVKKRLESSGVANCMHEAIQLPLWPEITRIIPNHIARSSLFAPIKRGPRKVFDRDKLASREDVEIFYTGKQLDMSDQDVFLQILEYFKGLDISDRYITVHRSTILKDIGKSKLGKSTYEWLEEAMHRLKSGTLTIISKRYKSELSLIDQWTRDEETGKMKIAISPEIKTLLSNNEFGYINWSRRKAIEHKVDLSKWLQTYIRSQPKGPQTHLLATIHKLSGSNVRPNDFFKDAEEAFKELQRIKEITKLKIDKRSATFIRLG